MSDSPKIRAHIYSEAVKHSDKSNLSRTITLWSPERGTYQTVLAGPRAEIFLHGSRSFRVTELGHVEVATHANNPGAALKPWLKLVPLWSKRAGIDGQQHDVLAGIMDERGGKVRFTMIDDMLEG